MIIFNVEERIEFSRLYLNSSKVTALVGNDDIQHCVNVKKENYFRQKKVLTDAVIFQEAFRDLITNILVGRATMTEVDGTKTFNLPVDATHCLLAAKPIHLEPFILKRQAKVTLADFESSVDQFKEEALKLKGASNLASRSAGLSKVAINAFKSTVSSTRRCDNLNISRKRWIKAINQILIKNYLAKVKIILNTKYTQFGTHKDEEDSLICDNIESYSLLNEKQGDDIVVNDTIVDNSVPKVTLPKLGTNNVKQSTANLFANSVPKDTATKVPNKVNHEKIPNRQTTSVVLEKVTVNIPKINKMASTGSINLTNEEDSRTDNEFVVKDKPTELNDNRGSEKKTKKPKRVLSSAIVVSNNSNILADGTYINQSPGAVAMLNAVTSITSIENDLMINKLRDEKSQHELLLKKLEEKNAEIDALKDALEKRNSEIETLNAILNKVKSSRKTIFYNSLDASRYNQTIKSDLLDEINATKSLLKQQQASHQVQLLKQGDEITRLKKENVLIQSSMSKIEHHRKRLLKQVFVTVANLMDENSEALTKLKKMQSEKNQQQSFSLDNDKIQEISSVIVSQISQIYHVDKKSTKSEVREEQIDSIIYKLDELKNVNMLCSDLKQSFDKCISEISLITQKEKYNKRHQVKNSKVTELSSNLRFRNASKSVQEILNAVDEKFSHTVDDQLDYYEKSINRKVKAVYQAEMKSEFFDEDTSVPWNS